MHLVLLSFGFGLVTASLLALAAVGFTLQFSVSNILNLAYGDVMTGAAFAAYALSHLIHNIWIVFVAAGILTGLFSAALNRFLYKPFVRRGTALFGMIVLTIAVALVVQNVLLGVAGASFYSLPVSPGASIRIGPFVFTVEQLVIIGIAVVAMVLVHAILRYTRLGKAMRGTADDPDLARNCGIPTDLVIDVAWFISGTLCGFAGVALAMSVTSFTVTFGASFLVVIIASAVLGGVGHAYGAMLGALVIGIATEVSAAYINPNYKQVVAFVILIAVLLVRPTGILAEVATEKEVAA
jgi:branched-chain amino acid transport system permease protein/neutral amino acid transport system permease protein